MCFPFFLEQFIDCGAFPHRSVIHFEHTFLKSNQRRYFWSTIFSTYFTVNLGLKMFVILCEEFIAISRYLTFAHHKTSQSYWNLERIHNCLIGIFTISLLYCSMFIACPFEVSHWNRSASFESPFNVNQNLSDKYQNKRNRCHIQFQSQ